MCIKKARQQIDKIDERIIDLISIRMEFAGIIGEYKKQNNIKIKQIKREQEVLKKIENLAEQKTINPDFAKKLFKQIINQSIEIEEKNNKT